MFENTEPDPKRARILQCAFAVVLRYGFQRTTMDDIAKEAGISRPALYLQFKNKTDIYRAIAEGNLGHALENAVRALDGEGSLEERDRKSTRLNSSHPRLSRMPSSA